MQGQVDAAKAYLESAEGQDFEKQVQESFLGGSPAKQSQLGQDSDSSNNDTGNAGQGEDSTSGMNSGELIHLCSDWYEESCIMSLCIFGGLDLHRSPHTLTSK